MPRMKNTQKAIDFGECFANNMFNMMLDVDNHGKTFCWENFPKVFEPVCRTSVFQIYSSQPKNIKKLEDIAVIAFMNAGEILKRNFPRSLPKKE